MAGSHGTGQHWTEVQSPDRRVVETVTFLGDCWDRLAMEVLVRRTVGVFRIILEGTRPWPCWLY